MANFNLLTIAIILPTLFILEILFTAVFLKLSIRWFYKFTISFWTCVKLNFFLALTNGFVWGGIWACIFLFSIAAGSTDTAIALWDEEWSNKEEGLIEYSWFLLWLFVAAVFYGRKIKHPETGKPIGLIRGANLWSFQAFINIVILILVSV